MSAELSIERYLFEQAEQDDCCQDWPPPSKDLKLVVVIPALAESGSIGEVVESLPAGSRRKSEVEIIVVVNNSEDAPKEIVADNITTIEKLAGGTNKGIVLHVVDRATRGRAYPAAVAGVGAARRTGMDLALCRLSAVGRSANGLIACLDADSPVAPGYLDYILGHFDEEKPPLAAVCAYRHRLPETDEGSEAIIAYELWLRYIELGFRLCGSPYAFQSVGSCIVVSGRGYALADGMPRRKAGEDFYFLQKIVKVGGGAAVSRIDDAIVLPSARVSDRVPFGTGRAMRRCRGTGPREYLMAAPLEGFSELGRFFAAIGKGFKDPEVLRRSAVPPFESFLQACGGWRALDKLRTNNSDPGHFTRAFHVWFDSLRVVRYVNRRRREIGSRWIFSSIKECLERLGLSGAVSDIEVPADPGAEFGLQTEWLDRLRRV